MRAVIACFGRGKDRLVPARSDVRGAGVRFLSFFQGSGFRSDQIIPTMHLEWPSWMTGRDGRISLLCHAFIPLLWLLSGFWSRMSRLFVRLLPRLSASASAFGSSSTSPSSVFSSSGYSRVCPQAVLVLVACPFNLLVFFWCPARLGSRMFLCCPS